MTKPVECPQCGQINAAENKTCVVCGSPLNRPPAQDGHPKPAPAVYLPTAARRRAYREMINRYMGFFGFIKWAGWLPLGFGIIYAFSIPALGWAGLCWAVPSLLIGAGVVWGGSKIQRGLQVGEQRTLDIVNNLHWAVYGIMGFAIFGLFIAGMATARDNTWTELGFLAIIPFGIIVANWYMHQAFLVLTGRKDGKIPRF
ncbi:MAG: zinc ribbon domain-containing protein [Anaerolineae bacterium]|nr:zinc ribbon domain-containing protein [Anaerolineae bacterium]